MASGRLIRRRQHLLCKQCDWVRVPDANARDARPTQNRTSLSPFRPAHRVASYQISSWLLFPVYCPRSLVCLVVGVHLRFTLQSFDVECLYLPVTVVPSTSGDHRLFSQTISRWLFEVHSSQTYQVLRRLLNTFPRFWRRVRQKRLHLLFRLLPVGYPVTNAIFIIVFWDSSREFVRYGKGGGPLRPVDVCFHSCRHKGIS